MITEEAKKKINLFLQTFFTTGNVGTGSDSTNPNSNSLDVPIITPAEGVSITATNTGDTSTDFKLVLLGSSVYLANCLQIPQNSETCMVEQTGLVQQIIL